VPNYRAIATRAARQAGIDPRYFLNQINQESGFNPGARSGAGAQGIAQIVPKYHPDAPGMGDPVGQLNWAARYMAGLIKKYGGSWEKALSVYNSGQPDKYLDPHFAGGQTYNYVRSIMGGKERPTAAPAASPGAAPTPGMPQAPAGLPAAPTGAEQAAQFAQQQARQIRQQAIGNLGAIASGQMKPTEAFGDLAGFIKTLHAQTPPVMVQAPHGGYEPVNMQDASSAGAKAAKMVHKYLGVHYVWGGESPKGFDCSGLLQYVWHNLGVNIPRVTYDQWRTGTKVSQQNLRPGDAVFFHPGSRGPEHVGMYVGNGMFIEAPRTGLDVRVSKLAGRSDFMGGRRFA